MKRLLAGLFTTMIMGFLIWSGLKRSPSPTRPAIESETDSRLQDLSFENRARLKGATDCIEGLLASARDGDAASYLRAFGGPLRAHLERKADERGRDAFALLLRRAGLARKSHAIFAPEPDGDRTDAARITVESAFADRLERQTFRLERAEGGWLITEIETAREHVPKNSLGSLATYEEPEGNPVASDLVESVSDAKQN
ncbi:MAG: hypothetical protein ACHRXM_08515 [Isosphaerales bacterium]